MGLDRKFKIHAESLKNGTLYTEENAILFLAKDRALLPTLMYYREICIAIACDELQITAVDLLIDRVRNYQAAHPEELKRPDVDPLLESSALLLD